MRLLLHMHHVEVGKRPISYGRPPVLQVDSASTCRIGDRLTVYGRESRAMLAVGHGAVLEIGAGALINSGSQITASRSVSTGDHLKLAENAAITDTGFHEIVAGGGVKVAPVAIGDNVWIGRGAMVMPGVTIGDGAVIGAGAIVTGDIPAFSIAVGVPARVIRKLPKSESPRR